MKTWLFAAVALFALEACGTCRLACPCGNTQPDNCGACRVCADAGDAE